MKKTHAALPLIVDVDSATDKISRSRNESQVVGGKSKFSLLQPCQPAPATATMMLYPADLPSSGASGGTKYINRSFSRGARSSRSWSRGRLFYRAFRGGIGELRTSRLRLETEAKRESAMPKVLRRSKSPRRARPAVVRAVVSRWRRIRRQHTKLGPSRDGP